MSNRFQAGVRRTATALAISIVPSRSVVLLAALCSTVLASLPSGAHAQAADTSCRVHLQSADFVGTAADLARLLDLQDSTSSASVVLRRGGHGLTTNACGIPASVAGLARSLASDGPHAGLRLLVPELLIVGNSAYARDWNDGALWGGRGLNGSLTGGVEALWGPLTAAIAPIVVWQSNSEYDITVNADLERSEFASNWVRGIDAPQRFGTGSFGGIDAGQSFARVDYRGFGAGVSNENIQWGPARRNALLLSGTAAGFPHVFLETEQPTDVYIGDLEVQAFWGRLDESEYFDLEPDNDRRMLAGLLIALQPRILDGLTIGGARIHSLTWWPELSFMDLALQPYRGIRQNPGGRGGDNQLLGVFFRWKSAPAAFEVYGEWARDDHWGTAIELLRNLDSSQAWSLGLQKLIRRGDNALRLSAELTHLADALPSRMIFRSGPISFYSNSSVTQGHTQRGQMLGAAIGTGAEALFVGGDYFWSGGRTSLSVERARYNEDAYNVYYAPEFRAGARDSELSVRAGHVALFGPVMVDAEVGWSVRYNRDLLGLADIEPGEAYRRDDNVSLRLGVRWSK